MDTRNQQKEGGGLTALMTAANDLRGRQSVRTTFKLSEATIHAVSLVAAHLGIKQKSLFDHLMDDLTALGAVTAEMPDPEPAAAGRVPKTYVISRRSLEHLERISQNCHTSRDVVVEFSLKRLLPIIEAERLQHEKRKGVLADLQQQTVLARELLRKTRLLLGNDDPVSAKVAAAVSAMEAASQQVEEFVERGRIIEEPYQYQK